MIAWARYLLERAVPRTDLGRWGERVAAAYLRRQGLRILERNVRQGRGEIDLVALDGGTLVFVEVKAHTRRGELELTGLEKIDGRKRAALRRACDAYRKRAPAAIEAYRLDAVAVEFEERPWRRRVRGVRWYPAVVDLDP